MVNKNKVQRVHRESQNAFANIRENEQNVNCIFAINNLKGQLLPLNIQL